MPWGAKSWLRLTSESSYGVYNAGGTVIWIELSQDNAFGMTQQPVIQTDRSADGGNRKRRRLRPRLQVAGQLTTVAYTSQMQALLDWATKLTSSQLPSYTADFFDSVGAHRYLGVMVENYRLASDSSSDKLVQTLQLRAQKEDPTPPTLTEPAVTVFPGDGETLQHIDCEGLVLRDGVAITKYKSFTFEVANTLAAPFDEGVWVSGIYYSGRDVTTTLSQQYVDQSWWELFTDQTALALEASWTHPNGTTVNLDFSANNYVSALGNDLPLGGIGYSDITLDCLFDAGTAGTDLTVTVV